MIDSLELRQQLKVAAQNAQHSEVLEISESLWSGGARQPNICLTGYRSALALDMKETAEQWVERGLAQEDKVFAWRFLGLKGELRGRAGDWESALQFFNEAAANAPNEGLPTFQVGKGYSRLGQYELAVTALRDAVGCVDTPHPSWLMELGMAELKVGNLQEAKDAFTKSNQQRPLPKLDWMIADIDRRLASGGSFSPEATAAFYDDVFESREEYGRGWEGSAYAKSWLRITEIMKGRGVSAVLDLGCGPGQFAACVDSVLPDVSYHGIDFSPVAIRRATSLVPRYKFSCLTLPLRDQQWFSAVDCVTCTEVLEHVTEDIPILEDVPDGVFIIFSVPNFDSFGHVRVFKSPEEVTARYGHLLEEIEIDAFPMGGTRVLWLARGIRRSLT